MSRLCKNRWAMEVWSLLQETLTPPHKLCFPSSSVSAQLHSFKFKLERRNHFFTFVSSVATMVSSILLLALGSVSQAAYLEKKSTIMSTSTISAQYFQISPESFQGTVQS